jgi:hypothetical protein
MNERLKEMRRDALEIARVTRGPARAAWELLAAVCDMLLDRFPC